jgi:hypothetical protein
MRMWQLYRRHRMSEEAKTSTMRRGLQPDGIPWPDLVGRGPGKGLDRIVLLHPLAVRGYSKSRSIATSGASAGGIRYSPRRPGRTQVSR